MIKLVVFDLCGIIFTEGHLIKNILYPMLPEPKDYKKIKGKYKLFRDGKITSYMFWKHIFKKNSKNFERKYLNTVRLDKNYFNVINYLKKKYKLAILSNMPADWADYFIKKFQFKKIFNPIVVSGKVKMCKPKKEIYRLLQRKTKIPFKEIILIDDKKENLKPAFELGMKTIFFKKEKNEFKFKPSCTIKSLSELKKIL